MLVKYTVYMRLSRTSWRSTLKCLEKTSTPLNHSGEKGPPPESTEKQPPPKSPGKKGPPSTFRYPYTLKMNGPLTLSTQIFSPLKVQ